MGENGYGRHLEERSRTIKKQVKVKVEVITLSVSIIF